MWQLVRRIAMGMISAAASAGLIAIELGVWDVGDDKRPIYILIGTAFTFAVANTVETAIRDYRTIRIRRLRSPVNRKLLAGLLTLNDLPGLSMWTTSVSAFILRRRTRPFWRQFLLQVDQLRLFPVSHTPGVAWVKGRGMLGACWDAQNVVVGDTGEPWEALRECSKQEWKAQPDYVRIGLRHKHFKAIVGKYEGVVCAPIVVRNRFRGVVAIDGQRHQVKIDDLLTHGVAAVAQSVAIEIAEVLAYSGR